MRARTRSRLFPLALLALAGLLGSLLPAAASQPDPRLFVLDHKDQPMAFWTGPPAEAGDCGSSCWTYRVTVTEPAFRLRVGIDRPLLGDRWTGELFRPNGTRVGSFSPGTELYSAEIHEGQPAVGTYTVRVTATDVKDLRFRMRAGIEKNNGGLPTGKVLVPPNLVPQPPWDFSFLLPITNGMIGGASTGVQVPTGRVACHAEEVVLYKAIRCLRFSYGVGNEGLGPLDLEIGSGNLLMDRPLIQRVRYADNTATSRSAGNAYFHHSHAHYHHDRAIGLDLLRVVDETKGTLEVASTPHRKGFAHRDELLRDWRKFYPVWTSNSFGLKPGWADYYEWDRPGNYIDFGLNPDGLYVVRITADPDKFVLETTTDDNVAYSLIRVTGEKVEHLQSGMGTDPWDECRKPLPKGPEFTDSFTYERPEHCETP